MIIMEKKMETTVVFIGFRVLHRAHGIPRMPTYLRCLALTTPLSIEHLSCAPQTNQIPKP